VWLKDDAAGKDINVMDHQNVYAAPRQGFCFGVDGVSFDSTC
jgi:hypothetical protein